MGDKVAAHIHWCMVGQGDRPKVCFGLTKEFDADPQFTFLILFRTGKKDCNLAGSEGRSERDGGVMKTRHVFSLGEFKFPLEYETKKDSTTGKVTDSNLVVGDLKVPDNGPRVLIVDLTSEKPAYKLVKAGLPACGVDLADKDRKTWAKAIDEAIDELKKVSNEIGALED
jgi:hypothetical protein